jgi:DNA helicase HerA-like ATPase
MLILPGFNEASKALLNQIESIVKLIRSKGVGIYFVTQNPTDVPEAVLSQLGLKVQHALRAFTANDRKAIKLTAQNYPDTVFYDTETVLTSLGTGEALVSALNEKGRPTPLASTMMRAPMSRMDILTDAELKALLSESKLVRKYNDEVDRESAYELLNRKIELAQHEEAIEKAKKEREQLKRVEYRPRTSTARRSTAMNPMVKVLTSATFIRSVFGILTKAMKNTR